MAGLWPWKSVGASQRSRSALERSLRCSSPLLPVVVLDGGGGGGGGGCVLGAGGVGLWVLVWKSSGKGVGNE